MIYDTLDYLPIKLYYKILSSDNTDLLSTKKQTEIDLKELWFELNSSFDKLDNSEENKRLFLVNKEIDSLKTIHKIILMSCEFLAFKYDEVLIDLLKGYGFSVVNSSTKEYHESLIKIERESKSISTKIKFLEDKLPKKKKGESITLDEVMASYSSVLGIDFDYNKISCTKFFALKKQVLSKVKSLEKNT